MTKATNADKARLIEYLSQDVENCVYLYIDIKTYDICSENVNVWFDEVGGKIKSVVMKYYDSFQIYSRDEEIDTTWITKMINEYKLSMVSGPRYLVEKVVDECEEYDVTYGEVFQCSLDYTTYDEDLAKVEVATVQDVNEVAKLLCEDEDFANNYKIDVLAKQMADRIEQKKGRTYFIRVDGRIVASASTFAETEDVAVLSGYVVDKAFRNSPFYAVICSRMNRDLCAEEKRTYTFATKKRIIRFLKYWHRNCAYYGKMQKKSLEDMNVK